MRDAYYALVASYATDDFMDQIGLDTAYRERTRGTLYTLEFHIHYLREVKRSTMILTVRWCIGARFRQEAHSPGLPLQALHAARRGSPAATAEFMLLHVHQGETVSAAAMPEETLARLGSFKAAGPGAADFAPPSRQLALRRN